MDHVLSQADALTKNDVKMPSNIVYAVLKHCVNKFLVGGWVVLESHFSIQLKPKPS